MQVQPLEAAHSTLEPSIQAKLAAHASFVATVHDASAGIATFATLTDSTEGEKKKNRVEERKKN